MKSGSSHTAENGNDRLLVFSAHAEHNTTSISITSVTYGGKTMTLIDSALVGTSYSAYTGMFYLDDADIDDASDSSFVVTWSTTPFHTPVYTSAFFENVKQADPIGDTDTNTYNETGGNGEQTLATSALTTSDGDMVLLASTCGNTGTYSTNNGFTEALELAPESADAVVGYKAADGSNETPSVTHSLVNRFGIVGAVLNAN